MHYQVDGIFGFVSEIHTPLIHGGNVGTVQKAINFRIINVDLNNENGI